MSENNEQLPESSQEPNQEPLSELDPTTKEQIKMEIKEEMKQGFLKHRRRKLAYLSKFLIVFLFGIAIGYFTGHHHHHDFRHEGYKMRGEHHMEMQNRMHIEQHRWNRGH